MNNTAKSYTYHLARTTFEVVRHSIIWSALFVALIILCLGCWAVETYLRASETLRARRVKRWRA